MKGKAIMLSIEVGGAYHTIAYATNHTFGASAQTSDPSTKDHNDQSVGAEVTGMSWNVNTDNLVEDNHALVNCGFKTLKEVIKAGKPINIHLRYYEDSLGKDSLNDKNDWVGKVPDAEAIISGQTIVTSLRLNAPNKENASYSATFTGKGAFTVG